MFGLSPIGLLHTLVSLAALAAAVVSLVKSKEISVKNGLGKFYVGTTAITALTAFGIFNNDGFGPGHALAVVTLVVIALALVASATQLFGAASRYVATIGLSATVLFHMIPGVTETLTRLPAGAPIMNGPEDPGLKPIMGAMFLIFLVGAVLQGRRLRAQK